MHYEFGFAFWYLSLSESASCVERRVLCGAVDGVGFVAFSFCLLLLPSASAFCLLLSASTFHTSISYIITDGFIIIIIIITGCIIYHDCDWKRAAAICRSGRSVVNHLFTAHRFSQEKLPNTFCKDGVISKDLTSAR